MIQIRRRRLLLAAAALPLVSRVALAQTPACGPQTEPQTPGPFFKPSSPERRNLREKSGATPLVISGVVLSASCKPLANALLDFWHADERGEYDENGFRYRGHQFTDSQGRWRLETIVPAIYPGRARHIHVKVQPPGGRVLTTQLYFPGEAANKRDGLFSDSLLLKKNSFDFVI
jgi:protocatechuate 3,4-dioxygenase beta subunit